jgi:anaerobic selenocysteine-containing dehydrogenase
MPTTHYRACNLCEAICGLAITTEDDQILSIKGDPNDPLSEGYICPKATALQDIQEDPLRLTKPMKRDGDQWQEVEWEDAFDDICKRLHGIQPAHGNNAVGIYAGNPSVHNYGLMTHPNQLFKQLRTQNRFSATSVDQLPHQLLAYLMYGHQFLIPIPDIDKTQFMLILGGNPLASNGSIMTVPNIRKRLQRLQDRGGKLVVVDPRRTETAAIADQHLFVRPGADIYLLMALINEITAMGTKVPQHLSFRGLDEALERCKQVDSATAAKLTGVTAESIHALAKDLLNADGAVCYGRMGVSVQEHGTLCQWAIQIINILTGNLDRVGGTLVTAAAFGDIKPGAIGPGAFGRWHSRVRKLPEFAGELPCAAMAEEILTPGEGQIRAMLVQAGNPVLSTPNGRQLDKAFEQLEFMVCFDMYLTETSRHADYILPSTCTLEHDHYDIAFHRFAVRNTARFNEAIFEKKPGAMHDWEIFDALGERFAALIDKPYKALGDPAALIDMGLQFGAYGSELSLATLREQQHGVDLGPLAPSLDQRLCTEDNQIDCLPELVANGLEALKIPNAADDALLLIGKRHIRSNNSWMHDYNRLVKGNRRDQLLVNPDDLAKHGLNDGDLAVLASRVGDETVTVAASDDLMPGTVCMPHGFGHQREGRRAGRAADLSGTSANDLTDDQFLDALSGNAALNALPVTLRAP